MINVLLIFPIIAAVLTLLIKNKTFNITMINIYAVLHFIITVLMTLFNIGSKSTTYFAVDNTNSVFLAVLSVVFLAVAIYNTGYAKNFETPAKRISRYSFMIIIFVLSMTGTLLSTDLGLAWILIEATTLSSAYLIYFNKTKHSIEAAWKYVFICSIGIALAFVGIILLNISSESINSLNFNELYLSAKSFNTNWLKMAYIFMLFGFGAKMGLAPVHFWLPDAHSEAPSPISALLSAALLNSAFLIILKVTKILNIAGCTDFTKFLLLLMGFMSLFITSVFVYHIKNYKRMLAYSSIENMGILAIGLALGGIAHYAVILHLIGHSLAKASFFLTSGNVLELFQTKRIKSVNGLYNADKKNGWLWILSFLAICAFPTSILFISEFVIVKSMIEQKHYALCILFLLLLTIILYGIGSAVIKTTFGKISEDKAKLITETKTKLSAWMYIPQIVLLIAVFVLGIYIPPCINNIIKLAASSF
ncbi:MAG: hypothetical protein NC191_01280 [Muribaculaceae bacterium]|nr:hypothetical protein [Muribaculaceae bacterium]